MSDTLEALKHLLWPTRCAACEVLLAQPKMLICEECRQSAVCAPDIPAPPGTDSAMALFTYEGAVRSMISKWKYHEDYSAQNAILSLLPCQIERLRNFIPAGAVIVPVPPHPCRLRERGFDPVWTFGSKLHKLLDNAGIQTAFNDNALMRTRHTKHQAGLTHDERLHNLDGAFSVNPEFKADHIILIDDVTTTGSTASVCAQTLKAAVSAWIGFIALAHPIGDEDEYQG